MPRRPRARPEARSRRRERNLAIAGVAVVAGAFVHLGLALQLLRHTSGIEGLFSPIDPTPFIGLLLFVAGVMRILAGPYI